MIAALNGLQQSFLDFANQMLQYQFSETNVFKYIGLFRYVVGDLIYLTLCGIMYLGAFWVVFRLVTNFMEFRHNAK